MLAGLLSLGAALYSARMQSVDMAFLVARAAAQVAPVPAGLIPRGALQPAVQPPLSVDQRRVLVDAMSRDPLAPEFLNMVYVDSIRNGAPTADVQRKAALLARLGWRYTPAQLNLLLNDLLDNRIDAALDHADALLRRQTLPSLVYAMLATMEALPETHRTVVERLVGNPKWRLDYLSVVGPQSSPALLDARIATIAALQGTSDGLTRDEVVPSLDALTATGRGRDAYRLWIRQAGRGDAGELIFDPRFQAAAAVAATSDRTVPFEWRLGQDLGYAAQASSEGVTISWDRRGVPVFLSQLVPVTPGHSYVLTIKGRSDAGDLPRLLAPSLLCGPTTLRFTLSAGARNEARYTVGTLPVACDMGVLMIDGALDPGDGGVDFGIREVKLRPAA